MIFLPQVGIKQESSSIKHVWCRSFESFRPTDEFWTRSFWNCVGQLRQYFIKMRTKRLRGAQFETANYICDPD